MNNGPTVHFSYGTSTSIRHQCHQFNSEVRQFFNVDSIVLEKEAEYMQDKGLAYLKSEEGLVKSYQGFFAMLASEQLNDLGKSSPVATFH
jgi:hypothetical protein